MNRDGVGGVGEVSVQARVVAAGYVGRVVVEFLVALLRAQDVRREGVHVGPRRTDQRKPLRRRIGGVDTTPPWATFEALRALFRAQGSARSPLSVRAGLHWRSHFRVVM